MGDHFFTKASVVVRRLEQEIIDAALPAPIEISHPGVYTGGTNLKVSFTATLTGGQVTTLSTVVTDHVATPLTLRTRRVPVRWRPGEGVTRVDVDDLSVFELADGVTQVLRGAADLNADAGIVFATAPRVVVPFVVTSVGSADGDVRLELRVRHLAAGESAGKTTDETLFATVSVTNTLKTRQVATLLLDGSLFDPDKVVGLGFARLGADAADTFDGAVGAFIAGALEF